MLCRVRHALGARPRSGDDAGLTLVEVMVSIAIIGTVMTSLSLYFSNTITATGYQSTRQSAVQLAGSAIEDARSLSATAVVSGRTQVASTTQWNAPVTGVAPYLTDMTMEYDTSGDTGATVRFPTTGVTVALHSGSSTGPPINYTQNWYVGRCYQPKGGGSCVNAQAAGSVPLLRIVVAVTWTGHGCASSSCHYVTSTMISPDADPTFPAAGS
jgi:prepilin-type N-terminal cleavage/methylation domain-containing protein